MVVEIEGKETRFFVVDYEDGEKPSFDDAFREKAEQVLQAQDSHNITVTGVRALGNSGMNLSDFFQVRAFEIN